MQPYQEEYIANLKEIAVLASRRQTHAHSLTAYQEKLYQDRQQLEYQINRNMELLRDGLFPLFDRLFEAHPDELADLEEFAAALLNGKIE